MEGKMFSTSALEYQHRLLCLQGCFFFKRHLESSREDEKDHASLANTATRLCTPGLSFHKGRPSIEMTIYEIEFKKSEKCSLLTTRHVRYQTEWRSSVAKWGSRQACLLPTWLYFSQSCFNTPVDPWILPLPELVPVPRWEYCSFTFYLFQEPHLLAQNESFYHNIAFVFDCSICRRCEGRRRSCCFDNQKFQLVYWR